MVADEELKTVKTKHQLTQAERKIDKLKTQLAQKDTQLEPLQTAAQKYKDLEQQWQSEIQSQRQEYEQLLAHERKEHTDILVAGESKLQKRISDLS